MLASKQLTLPYVSATGELATTGQDGTCGAEPLDRRRLVFAIVSIGLFMASIDQTIVATALPAIERELHATINWSGWTISIYALGQVIAMPMAGKISDMYGRKKVFMISAAIFTLSSLCCGFAPNMALLLLPRFIQALGGGAFMPSATGIVSDHFGAERDRARACSRPSCRSAASSAPSSAACSSATGPGGASSWSTCRSASVLIALTVKFIPASAIRPASRIDIRGIVLLAVLIATAMFGITYLGSGQVPLYSPVFLGCEAAAVVTLYLFVRHSRRAAAPFVPYRLLRGRGFGIMNLINYVYGAAALGFAALVPLYAQERYHIAPLGAGTLLTARAVGMIAVAGAAAMALRRTGYRLPMIAGFAILAGGLLMMAIDATAVALHVAGHRHRRHRLRHGAVGAGRQQREPAARPRPGGRDRRAARHVPPVRGDHRGLGDHGGHRAQRSSRPGPGPRVLRVRGPARAHAAAGQAGARPPRQLVMPGRDLPIDDMT